MEKYLIYLIRYAEIGIKSRKTRSKFEKILINNIKSALEEIDPKSIILSEFGRIYIHANTSEVEKYFKKIFGIFSFSPIIKISSNRKELIEETVRYSEETLKGIKTFSVRCHRVGQHTYSSKDIEIEAGSEINKKFGNKLKVDLSSPDKTIYIEIRNENAYLYHEIFKGPGGLPSGTQGKFVSLLSGGIDSPVATYLMMKRGAIPILLYFDNRPYTDEHTNKRVIKVAKVLKSYAPGKKIKLFMAPYGNLLEYVSEKIRNLKYLCLLCKRNMLKIAQLIAKKNKADAIVTGESIGQKASQTLRNSMVISDSIKDIPIHRPVIALDKIEIENIAKKIGTFNVSISKAGCCTAVPRFPSIEPDLIRIQEEEYELNLDNIIEEIVKNLKSIELN
jgi:thiamine biosynthesis protein ThiI